jgi:hypothetical protein
VDKIGVPTSSTTTTTTTTATTKRAEPRAAKRQTWDQEYVSKVA